MKSFRAVAVWSMAVCLAPLVAHRALAQGVAVPVPLVDAAEMQWVADADEDEPPPPIKKKPRTLPSKPEEDDDVAPPGPAPATGGRDNQVMRELSADVLVSILADEGYSGAKIERPKPTLDVVVVKMNGYNVLFFCEKEQGHLQACFAIRNVESATLRRINQWNLSKKFFRAYLDKDGDPVMEYDLVYKNGVTRKTIRHFISTTNLGVRAFLDEVCKSNE